jgi:hypothetical protein
MDNDSTSSGSDIDPPVYPTGPCTQILSWPLRMKAAFAKFPVNDDPLSVHKFSQGFEWELVSDCFILNTLMFIQFQWYVAATIGFAHLNYQQFEIPALLRKANRYTHLTYHKKQPFLHEPFQSLLEVQTGSAPPGGWPNAWWEELSTASFPELTVSYWLGICPFIFLI